MIQFTEKRSGRHVTVDAVELVRHRQGAAPAGIEFVILGVRTDVSFICAVRALHDANDPTHDDNKCELVDAVLEGCSLETLRVELEVWLEHHLSTRHIEAGREAIRRAVRAVRDDPSGDLLPGLLDGAQRKQFESLTKAQQRWAMDPKANHI